MNTLPVTNPFLSSIAFFNRGINVLRKSFFVQEKEGYCSDSRWSVRLRTMILKEKIDKIGKFYKIIQVILDILEFKC